MRIMVFNVGYSANLGDGLLSECLIAELRSISGAHVDMRDLAGRRGYGEGGKNRRLQLGVLAVLPAFVRQRLVETVLNRKVRADLHPYWSASLKGFDAIVIGGGNLFADADLNFPLKVRAALTAAAAADVPAAIHAVGVSKNWTSRGRQLFLEGLETAKVLKISVRDEASRAAWTSYVPPEIAPPAQIALDPGLLTARHFPRALAQDDTVALGIVHPMTLRYHAIGTQISGGLREAMAGLAAELVGRGYKVRLFTNGSPEDEHFLSEIAPALVAQHGAAISIEPPFRRPADLANFVASKAMVIAHRMHACIAAYAYGVPCVGLAWDPKLAAFFDLSGRREFVADPAQTSPASIAGLAERALSDGIDETTRARLEREAGEGIASLFAALRSRAGELTLARAV